MLAQIGKSLLTVSNHLLNVKLLLPMHGRPPVQQLDAEKRMAMDRPSDPVKNPPVRRKHRRPLSS
jgi:hypothetical protein